MPSVETYMPQVIVDPGDDEEDARPCFGGPCDGQMRAVPKGRDHFVVEVRPSLEPVIQANLDQVFIEPVRREAHRYYRETWCWPISDLLYQEAFVWLCDGWQMSDEDSHRISWEVRNSTPKLIPEPNILTQFDLWFRRACFKHKITERCVREAYNRNERWL